MNRLNKWVIIAILLSVVLLNGCGKKESDDTSGQMVLNLALKGKLTGFDPMDMRDYDSMEVASHIMETLYQFHFLKRPYELVPLLAEDMPQISEDMMVYTVKIKKGVYYQDDKCFGDAKTRELKSEDFVYALKRIANTKNISKNWSMFDDKIVGLDEFREYTKNCKSKEEVDYSREIEGLQCLDDYTLVIKLKKPWPQIVGTALADMATSPIAKEAVDYYGKDIV
ncbi:MAG: ABC transporter substrate-binding protein, partial [Phycisphaerales bacterium]